DDGMVGGGFGADHHETAGFLVVLVGVGRGPRAHRDQHGLHRGRVTEPGAVVHVVGAHDVARQLLDDVAVLVGRLGGGERAEAPDIAREAVGGGVQGLVPADFVPAVTTFDHGRDDTVARVDEAGAEAALHAEHPAARQVLRGVVGHAGQPPV